MAFEVKIQKGLCSKCPTPRMMGMPRQINLPTYPHTSNEVKIVLFKKIVANDKFFLGVTNNFSILYTKKNIGNKNSQDLNFEQVILREQKSSFMLLIRNSLGWWGGVGGA
jgi:hypothetical protein